MATSPHGRRLDSDALRQAEIDQLRQLLVRSKGGYDAVPIGVKLDAWLTAAEVDEYFDSTGLGRRGRRYAGYAICNGNNDTPNVNGKFPRFNTSVAGGTGGSDSSAHTHAAGSLFAEISMTAAKIAMNNASHNYTHNRSVTATGFARTDPDAGSDNDSAVVAGTTGAASATDNRPAYYEWVPVMRIR